MNSRLNYNDIKNIGNFMIYKLKYTNFKEMMDKQNSQKVITMLT